MRDDAVTTTPSRGLTLPMRVPYGAQKRPKNREVSERRQVGDAESLVNQPGDGGRTRRGGGDDSEL